MPATLPPVPAIEHAVNDAAADLGVTRPAVLDHVDHAVAGLVDHGCLHLHLGNEVRLATRVHVSS